MESNAIFDRLFQHNNAGTLFTPLSFDETTQLFVNEDKSLSFGFICDPISGLSPAMGRLDTLLCMPWRQGTIVQVSLFASPDIYQRVNEIGAACNNGDEFLKPLHEQRRKFFLDGSSSAQDNHQEMLVRNYQLIFTVKSPLFDAIPTGQESHKLSELRQQFSRQLKEIGFSPATLNAQNFLYLMRSILDWSPGASWRNKNFPILDDYNDEILIRDQIIDIGHRISFTDKAVYLGDKICKVLSFSKFPKEMSFNDMLYLIGDPIRRSTSTQFRGNYILTLNLIVGDSEKLKSKIQTKRNMVTHQAFGPLLKWLPQLSSQKQDLDALSNMFEQGQRPVDAYLGMMVFSNNEKESIDQVTQIKSRVETQKFKALDDRYFCFPLFLELLPFGAKLMTRKSLSRYKPLSSKQASKLFPVYADPKGSNVGVPFLTRKGQLFCFDIFDSQSSYNFLICAQSGGGKSFVANSIIQHYLARGAKIWVIDSGGSYKKSIELLNGSYIDLSLNSDISMNPLTITKDLAEDMDTLLGIFEQMTKPIAGFDDEDLNCMRNALVHSFKQPESKRNIDTLINSFDTSDNKSDLLIKLLKRYSSEGELGHLFNQTNKKNAINFDSNFTAIDLEGLAGQKQLQLVLLLELVCIIGQVMSKYPKDVPKLLFIDEAWKFFKDSPVAGVPRAIENGFRTYRKQGGACGLITQSPFDLSDGLGQAVMSNTPNKLYFSQDPSTLESAIKQEKIVYNNEYYHDLLRSLQTEPGVFSELFIDAANGDKSVVRLYEPRYIQLMNTTHPGELSAISKQTESGYSMHEAILNIINNEQLSE